jgi:hypothetical protein
MEKITVLNVPPVNLDINTIYIFFACPACKMINQIPINDVGFGFEMDMTVNDPAACQPWIECNCMGCGTYLEKQIGRIINDDVESIQKEDLN